MSGRTITLGDDKGLPDALCPICHEPRKEHGCSSSVDLGSAFTSSYRIHLAVFCYHPDTVQAMANARRYLRIKAPEFDIPEAVEVA